MFFVIIVKSEGFRVCDRELWRCNFQDLLTHLNRTRDPTGRNESTSKMSSSGRNAGDRVIIIIVVDVYVVDVYVADVFLLSLLLRFLGS